MAATNFVDKTNGKVLVGTKEYSNVNSLHVKVRQLADDSLNVLIRTDDEVIFMGKGTDMTIDGSAASTDPDTLRDALSTMFNPSN